MKVTIEVPLELIQKIQCDSKLVNGFELTGSESFKVIKNYLDHLMGVSSDDVSYCYDEYVSAYLDNEGVHPCKTSRHKKIGR